MVIPQSARQRLREAPWLRSATAQQLLALLEGGNGRTRAVGGVVRDTLLGRTQTATDLDLATELRPDDVLARAAEAGIAAYPTGIAHGTVMLRIDGLAVEVTTLREDVETDGRHAVVRFGTDWRRDAERRDFTLNALYAGMDGELFDPIGGAEDCLAGRVRFIGEADRRIAEDRLRVYRFFRFSASHGEQRFDAAGLAAVERAAGQLGALSAERVGAEMRKMLALPRIASTLKAMAEAGVLGFPEVLIEHLASYERRAGRPSRDGRLALLVDDLSAEALKRDWRLSNDEVAVAEMILAAAALLRAFKLHEAAYRFPAVLAEGVDLAGVQAQWTEAGKSAVLQQLALLKVPRFPVTGGDLIRLGFEPGRALGMELERLERLWIDSGFALDRAGLLAGAGR